MNVHIASDDAFAQCIWEIPKTNPASFERDAAPPEGAPLRLLVDDGHSEYALPWAYLFHDDDFTAVKTGRALHDSIAVRGWRLWEGARTNIDSPETTI